VVSDGESFFEWEPGFYAGEVTAELVSASGRTIERYLLDVSPSKAKLGRELFRSMINEIREACPSLLFGEEPAQDQLGHEGDEEKLIVKFARLRGHAEEMFRAFEAVSERPIRSLRSRREEMAIRSVRRADQTTVLNVLRSPAFGLLTGASPTPAALGARLDVPQVEQHLDGDANRCLTRMLELVRQRCREMRARMGQLVECERSEETRTALEPRWPARRAFLDDTLRRCDEALHRLPFAEVTHATISAAGLNGVAANPDYARAHGLAWRILRPGVGGELGEDRMWISPTWEVFESWCYVRLVKGLQRLFPDVRWRETKRPLNITVDYAMEGEGPDGRIILLFQPRFPRGDTSSSPVRSVSREMRPDLVVLFERPDNRRFLVFDAKYSQSASAVLQQMDTAHLYHDALRWGERRCEISLLLVPAAEGSPWLREHAFQDSEGVGVVAMEPGSPGLLPARIEELLATSFP